MEFPNTWEEFEKSYGFVDIKEIYTNGSRLIPSFRVEQWLDHIKRMEQKKGTWIDTTEVIGFPSCKCSVCGSKAGMKWMNFCPNCGADLRGN